MAELNYIDDLLHKIFIKWQGFARQNYEKNLAILTNFANGLEAITKEGWLMQEQQKLTKYKVNVVASGAEAMTVACLCGVESSLILQQQFDIEPGLKPFENDKPATKNDVESYEGIEPVAYVVVSTNNCSDEKPVVDFDKVLQHQKFVNELLHSSAPELPDDYYELNQTESAMYRAKDLSKALEQKAIKHNRHIFEIL